MSISYAPASKTERTVIARCDLCGVVCDGIWQKADASGDYWPHETQMLTALGWHRVDSRDFCGRLCRDKHAASAIRNARENVPVTKPILARAAPIARPQQSSKR